MTKSELVAQVAQKTGLSKKDAERAVSAMLETMTEELVKGEKVLLSGFGVFEVKHRASRVGRNPQTREEVPIPAGRQPVFKASKNLKDMVG